MLFTVGWNLLDLTIADPRHRRRLRSYPLARSPLDYFVGPNEFGSSDLAWRRYIGAFGMAAALQRERTRTAAGTLETLRPGEE
jgi:hypothetical protein